MSKTLVNSILKENEALRNEVRELRRRCQFLELRNDESGSRSAQIIDTLTKKVSLLENELNSLSQSNIQLEYRQPSNVKTISIDGDSPVSADSDVLRRASFGTDLSTPKVSVLEKVSIQIDRDPEILSFCFEISDAISKLGSRTPGSSQFEDSNHRSSNVFAVDLYNVLVREMGASTLVEVLSTVTERDLINFGIPLVKARLVMQHIIERGSVILDEVMEEKRARKRSSKHV